MVTFQMSFETFFCCILSWAEWFFDILSLISSSCTALQITQLLALVDHLSDYLITCFRIGSAVSARTYAMAADEYRSIHQKVRFPIMQPSHFVITEQSRNRRYPGNLTNAVWRRILCLILFLFLSLSHSS